MLALHPNPRGPGPLWEPWQPSPAGLSCCGFSHAAARNGISGFFCCWLAFARRFLYWVDWIFIFFPQGGGYKVEMEMWLVLLVVFAAAAWVDRAPAIARVALALILLWPAVAQVK